MISFGSCIYPTLNSAKVSRSRVASPENYKHQKLKVSGVTHCPELPQLPPYGLNLKYVFVAWALLRAATQALASLQSRNL